MGSGPFGKGPKSGLIWRADWLTAKVHPLGRPPMRPATGVTIELAALAGVLLAVRFVPGGPQFLIYALASELLATYLVHCPAHYVVGTALGMRFRRIKIGRTTLARTISPRLAGLSGIFAVPTLVPDRNSLSATSPRRAAAMYASGTLASVASAFVVAAAFTASLSTLSALLAWGVAVGYLVFDAVFSPRTGDLMRARRARDRR
jgi:hypothetical protein